MFFMKYDGVIVNDQQTEQTNQERRNAVRSISAATREYNADHPDSLHTSYREAYIEDDDLFWEHFELDQVKSQGHRSILYELLQRSGRGV